MNAEKSALDAGPRSPTPSFPDRRALHVRVRALAQRFDAIAIGARKKPGSVQDATNAERDAATLHAAANKLERVDAFERSDS